MPPAIGAAGAAIGAALVGATLTQVALVFGATLVLGFVSQLLAPKPPKLSNRDQGRRQIIRSSIEPMVIVYGETLVGGLLVFAETTGTDNKYLHLMIAVTGHEIEAINSVYFANDEITNGMLDGNGVVTSGRYANKARIRKHLGGSTQNADTFAVNELTNWTTAHRGRGIAYLYVRLEWNRDVYPTGIPNMRFVVKGKKVWDPRTDPGAPAVLSWSDNAALCQLDYIRSKFGFKAALDEVDEPSWVAAANICDELVSLKGGGTEKRYTANGQFLVDRDKFELLEDLLTASVGSAVYQQGKFKGYAAKATVATNTLGEDDLRSDISIVSSPSRSNLFNTVQGTYFDKAQLWAATDFPQVSRALYVADDFGEELVRDMILPYTDTPSKAQRIAALNLDRHRQGIVVSFPAKLKKFNIAPMDVVQVSIGHIGWVNKEFRVIDMSFSDDAGINFTLQEEASAIYDYDPDDEIEVDPAPDTNLPDPWIVLPPEQIRLDSSEALSSIGPDGTILNRLKIDWDILGDAFLVEAEIQTRNVTLGEDYDTVAIVKGLVTTTTVGPVTKGHVYDIRVRVINALGVASPYTERTNYTIVGKTTLPPTPNNLVVGRQSLVWSYTDKPADFAGYVVRAISGSIGYWDSGFPLHPGILSEAMLTVDLPFSTPTTFMVKAVNTSGLESEIPISVTRGQIPPIPENVVRRIVLVDSTTQPLYDTDPTDRFWIIAGSFSFSPNLSFWDIPMNDNGMFWGTMHEALDRRFTVLPTPAEEDVNTLITFDVEAGGVYNPWQLEINETDLKSYWLANFTRFFGSQAGDNFPFYFTSGVTQLDNANFWGPVVYKPLTTSIKSITRQTYMFQALMKGGWHKGAFTKLDVIIDALDVIEKFTDVTISVSGTRLPIMKKFKKIVGVQLSVKQGVLNPVTAIAGIVLDLNHTFGPLIQTIDINGDPIAGVIDATVQGI